LKNHKYAMVDNFPGYKRDLESGAIVISDDETIIKSRQALKKKKREKQELEKLKDDVTEIKELLSTLLNKIGD